MFLLSEKCSQPDLRGANKAIIPFLVHISHCNKSSPMSLDWSFYAPIANRSHKIHMTAMKVPGIAPRLAIMCRVQTHRGRVINAISGRCDIQHTIDIEPLLHISQKCVLMSPHRHVSTNMCGL